MRSSLVAAAVACFFSFDRLAAANGRFPAANQLVFSPSDTTLVVLRTTFGVMISHDRGATWGWLCEDALGVPPASNEDPSLGVTASNALIAGFSGGVAVSPDTGCSWTAARPLQGQFVKDVAVRSNAAHSALAITATYSTEAAGDAGAGYVQQVFQSTDDGATWSPLGAPLAPNALVTSIEAAAGDPARLYVSAFRDPLGGAANAGARTAVLFASSDGGAHWTERPVPFDPTTETAAYIAAVDPVDADRVYVRTSGTSRLLVTTDGGQSFQVALSLTSQMLGFALSSDGSTVYVGSKEQGLFVAPHSTLAFRNVSAIHVECLATHGADLWACADEPSGFIAGVSQDDGATFTAKLHLAGIRAPLACESADAAAARCSGAPFEQLCASLASCPPESGSAGPSVDGGTFGAQPNARGTGGCSTARGDGAAAIGAVLALAAIASTRRRSAKGSRSAR